MNKLSIIAVSALAAFTGWCGWLAYHYQGGEDNSKGLYAPNAMHRIAQPPPIGPDVVGLTIVAAADPELRINGKVVVSSRGNMNDPERHDVAHAMYRAERKLTQVKTN